MAYETFQEVSDYFQDKDSSQSKVFSLLKDYQWHCRECEGKKIGSGQYRGGGGIQGLERGTKHRTGLVIETNTMFCKACEKDTKQDRLTGEVKASNAPSGIPPKLIKRDNSDMSEEEIYQKFQLLKKDEGGNHNLLKSRSCERCIQTGMRGYPFGIKYWYEGNEEWDKSISPKDEQGCIGCGWYDIQKWRDSLNKLLEGI